jgi:hypothetical protein
MEVAATPKKFIRSYSNSASKIDFCNRSNPLARSHVMPPTPGKPYTVALRDGYNGFFTAKVRAPNPQAAALKALNEALRRMKVPACRTVAQALFAHIEAKPHPMSTWMLGKGGRTPRDIARRAYRRRLTVEGQGRRDTGAWQLWDGWLEGDHGPAPSLPYTHPSERKDKDGLTWVGLPSHAALPIARGWFTPFHNADEIISP